MHTEAKKLLATIRDKPWPAVLQLTPGVTVLSIGKLVSRTESYLRHVRADKPAHAAYVDRLRLLNERLDEVRMEQYPGGVPAGATAMATGTGDLFRS